MSENPLAADLNHILDPSTRHALDFAIHGKAVKFLLTSSGAVYGKQPGEGKRIRGLTDSRKVVRNK